MQIYIHFHVQILYINQFNTAVDFMIYQFLLQEIIAEIVVIAQLIYPLEIQPHLVHILSGLCVQQSFGLLGALYLRIHSLCTMMEFI